MSSFGSLRGLMSGKRPLAWVATLLIAGAAAATPWVAHAQTKIKMVLNWKYQGPQAWFFIAQDRGYFKAEGLEVEIDQGEGSSAPIAKVASGSYNAGFGDINALIAMVASRPNEAPVAVYQLYNTPPFAVAVKADSPIRSPKDFEGRTVGGPANDGALKLFPAFASTAGIDPSKVKISNMAPNLREQMLLRGQVDAVFGFINTIWFSAKLVGIDPAKDLRFIRYGDHGMDLYSNTIIFSRALVRDNPKAVAGFLTALNRAIKDVVANPEAGMDAVMKREPLLKRDVERERLIATIRQEMSHPEIAKIGFGDVDPQRLSLAIKLVAQANELPRVPAVGEVFNRSLMPALSERIRSFEVR
jgi:NitT/TauT family transport system substrate-binding protein